MLALGHQKGLCVFLLFFNWLLVFNCLLFFNAVHPLWLKGCGAPLASLREGARCSAALPPVTAALMEVLRGQVQTLAQGHVQQQSMARMYGWGEISQQIGW